MKNHFRRLPKAHTENIVVTELKDELLIYRLETHQAYCLNKTAAAVYQSADGTKTASEIAEALSKQLKAPVTEEFVLFSLDKLKTKNLLEDYHAEIESFGQSRRELIRKIGLSTVVALPIITMMVAPKAADAQSAAACGDNLDSCSGSGQGTCCSGFTCCPVINECRISCPL